MQIFLKTKLRRKLLAYTFMHVDEAYYVRELASFIHEDAGNLSRELKKLEGEGVYNSTIRGKLKFYSLNKKYPCYEELKTIIFKTVGVEGSLKEIVARFQGVLLSFIHGSFARSQETASSDVDVVVVGNFDRDAFTQEVRILEKRFNREINFTIYAPNEYRVEKKKSGNFLNLVVKNKIILLKGEI